MNRNQYAKRVGVSRNYIGTLVKLGVIPLHDGSIDPEEADAILKAQRNPSYDHKRKAQLDFSDPAPSAEGAEPESPPPLPAEQGVDAAAVPFHHSKAVKEYYNAMSAKVEFEVTAGNLVKVEDVERDAFTVYRNVRDALQNIPNRIAAAIAAELQLEPGRTQDKVFAIMNKEILEALEGIPYAPR